MSALTFEYAEFILKERAKLAAKNGFTAPIPKNIGHLCDYLTSHSLCDFARGLEVGPL